MNMVKKFIAFAIKGNVMSLALGLIIGAAFGKIIESPVVDLIMTPAAEIMGRKLDFSGISIISGEVPPKTA